jgi:poly(A) polymerase
VKERVIKLTKKFQYSPELLELKKILLKDKDDLRLVGGCVRDFLVGKENYDIDLATKHRPEDVTALLKKAKITVIPTGILHGTVTAIVNGKPFEITTLRQDLICDGRHAKVQFGTDYLEDARRRDFTINAMYIDFENNLYDYFDGLSDLHNGLIKFIGEPTARIEEDYLRILRLFRFYCYYGKEIDKKSLNSCAEKKAGIQTLSGERISAELFKILNAANPAGVLKTMQRYGILQEIFYKQINLSHIVKLIMFEKELRTKTSYIFRLGMVLKDEPEKEIMLLSDELRFSNEQREMLLSYKKPIEINHMASENTLKELMLDYTKEKIVDSLIINIMSYTNKIDPYIRYRFNSIKNFLDNYTVPKLPINGDDLINIGISEGKKIGELLKLAKKYWIKSNYTANKEEIINNII